jgi:hypothetical protein
VIDNTFRFRADWRDRTPEGERDVANITLQVGTEVLSRVLEVETGEVRDWFRASAVSLALWLTDNWWRLRWEPLGDARPSPDWRLAHEFSSAGSGFNWPPIMAYGTGPRVILAPAFGARPSSGPIRYLEMDLVHVLPGEQFEATIDRFINSVLERHVRAKDGDALRANFDQLLQERADPASVQWRALEARLGFDPDAAPEELIEQLGSFEDSLGKQAVEEAAAADPGLRSAETLERVVEASKHSELVVSLKAADVVDTRDFHPRDPTWRWAEDAAHAVRKHLGVTGVFGEEAFAALLETPWTLIAGAPATAYKLAYSGLLRQRSDSASLALKMRPTVHRRFELARMVGDAIWTRGEAFGVVSRTKTERQKFQRGFAFALLSPFSELRRYISLEAPTDLEIRRAARWLGVHETVVRTVLVHKNVLPRETLLQRLEAA